MAGENEQNGKTQKDSDPQLPPKPSDIEKLTSIVQIDDSELPQSVKDKFKD